MWHPHRGDYRRKKPAASHTIRPHAVWPHSWSHGRLPIPLSPSLSLSLPTRFSLNLSICFQDRWFVAVAGACAKRCRKVCVPCSENFAAYSVVTRKITALRFTYSRFRAFKILRRNIFFLFVLVYIERFVPRLLWIFSKSPAKVCSQRERRTVKDNGALKFESFLTLV